MSYLIYRLTPEEKKQKYFNPFILNNNQIQIQEGLKSLTKSFFKNKNYHLIDDAKINNSFIEKINDYKNSNFNNIKKENLLELTKIINKPRNYFNYYFYPIGKNADADLYGNIVYQALNNGRLHLNPPVLIKKKISKKLKDILKPPAIKQFLDEEKELLEKEIEMQVDFVWQENTVYKEIIEETLVEDLTKEDIAIIEEKYEKNLEKIVKDPQIGESLNKISKKYFGAINWFFNQIRDKQIAFDCLWEVLENNPRVELLDELIKNKYKEVQAIIKEKRSKLINQSINLNEYEKDFEEARKIKRKFYFYLGPTNSGKTYAALQNLIKAGNGCYLAPLRLLALEGQENLMEMGVGCNLLTGEERIDQKANFNSMTIEMCDFNKTMEAAVIDEVQMCLDIDRGWAWTNAICGVAAKNVYLVGSSQALPYIEPLLKRLGEEFEIVNFERKNDLKLANKPIRLKELEEGDALIAFSRKEVLNYKEQLEKLNKKVSVVYGALTPEVRKKEAARFRSGQTQVLVATDAIGMGLNLPIKRIVFSEISKYDGFSDRGLSKTELKQIGGRAGRYGIHEEGIISALEHNQLQYLKQHFDEKDDFNEEILDNSLLISPTINHIKKLSELLKTENIDKILKAFKEAIGKNNTYYKVASMESMLNIAKELEKIYGRDKRVIQLNLEEKFKYCCAPLAGRFNREAQIKSQDYFLTWMKTHLYSNNEVVTVDQSLSNYDDLATLEEIAKTLVLYKWLSFKFSNIYVEKEQADLLLGEINDKIEKALSENKKPVNKLFKK